MPFSDIVTIGAFLVICLLVFLLGETLGGGRRRALLLAKSGEENESRRKKPSTIGAFTRAMAGAVPQLSSEVDRIERDLKRAGYYKPTALIEYMATRNTLIVLTIIVAGGLAVAADPGTAFPEMFIAGGVILAILGYGLPRMVLNLQAKQRVGRIQRGLPDALDIIRMCLTGGLPLREALQRVTQEIDFFHPEIAVEFEIIRRQADADTMAHALRQFARRIDIPDINALAALVMQTDRLGTHVATAITDYADSVRRATRQRAEEKSSKTSIKMLFPVVLCLSPPIYILLCGPPLLKLRTFVIEGNRPGGLLDQSNYGETILPEAERLLPSATTEPR